MSGPLVDPDWIAAHLGDPTVRLVEVDVSPAAYAAGHIPGAVLWNAYVDLRRPDYTLVEDAELESLLSRTAVGGDTTLVFYGYAAHLGYWLMTSHGHADVRLMDGPRDRWIAAGRSWSDATPAPEPSSYVLGERKPGIRPSRQDVEAMIGDPAHVLLDVRSQAEYEGERFWPSGAPEEVGRAGRIPGSVNVPIEMFRTDDGGYRDPEEIRRALADAGVRPDRRVVAYCTIGNRASQAWFALSNLLGYPDATVYYGSWAEWGMDSNAPVEMGAGGFEPP